SSSHERRCTGSALRSNAARRALVRAGWMACLLVAYGTAALAQTSVRVTRDQSPIWKRDFASAAAVVRAGTVLIVIGGDGDWYDVVVPDGQPAAGATGFIFKANVEAVKSTLPVTAPRRPT